MTMISKNFDLRELVHPAIYNHPRIGARCADFLNINLAPTLEAIRHNFSDIIMINNWHTGGTFENSGLRDWHNPIGAGYSSHYYGNTADCKFKIHTPVHVYQVILNNQDMYPYITRMESAEKTVSWLHVEVGNAPRVGDIVTFDP